MKKIFTLAIALIVITTVVGIAVKADDLGEQSNYPKPYIKTLGVLGKGLAVSQTDPMSFKLLKVGIAKMNVSVLGEETEITIGVLFLDDEKYKVKDIVLGNDSVTANLYSNDTKVGSLQASSITKGDSIIWAGTMTVNSNNYNIYVLEVARGPKPFELVDKVGDFCKENPVMCLRAAGQVVKKADEVKDFCKENPDNEKCKKIFRFYCQNNLQDSRCKEALKEYCESNSSDEICQNFELEITKKYCTDHPNDSKCVKLEGKRIVEYCVDNPDDNRCVALKNAAELGNRLDLITFCKKNSDSEKCEIFCKSHPLGCKRHGVPFLIGNNTGNNTENNETGD